MQKIAPFMLAMVKKYHIDHVVGFLLVFVIVSTGYLTLGAKSNVSAFQAFVMGAMYVLAIAVPLYIARGFLVPRFLYTKRNIIFFVLLTIFIIVSGIVIYYIAANVILAKSPQQVRYVYLNPISILFNILFFIAFPVITGVALKILGDQIRTKLAYEEALREKKQAELDYLKSQLNPHFLFNAINTVYFQVDESVTDAKKTMELFSDMLRYQLYECNRDKVPIEKEVAYINDYIAMQLLRRDSNYKVSFDSEGIKNFDIAPLLLIPFVENAFKYWSSYSINDNTIHIKMDVSNGYFHFIVTNTMEQATGNGISPNTGIGLENVKKRLALLYPGNHILETGPAGSVYEVSLKIKL